MNRKIRALDLFAGMGGSSWGAYTAGVEIAAAIDMWDLASFTYVDNMSNTTVYSCKCEDLSPHALRTQLGGIDLLIASPECTGHSVAKGARLASQASLSTAFQVSRFAKVFKPRWLVVENVVNMRDWDRYTEWRDGLVSIGYNISEVLVDAADFGVPQSRRRLFILGDSSAQPPDSVCPTVHKKRAIRRTLRVDGKYSFSRLASKDRSPATVERAKRATKALGREDPFLLVYYSSDGAGGWQSLGRPLRTITTVDRFALVRRGETGFLEMRMLQVPELQRAMGFPPGYKMQHGTRRQKIKLLGNAVCPPVMRAVIESLVNA